ncbi:dihydrofolate reductase [Gaetbulibacter aestuarii]|uniref:dihydrofolate reductase n=1 Tax=Gaetbulibacter aestuarii TaxID=1502358 RepID=A0ABW7N178_9FLAO
MFNKNKTDSHIDKAQLELIENAQKRIRQKKHLYSHFVVFLIGSLFFILANVVFGVGKDFTIFNTQWFVIAITIWLFFLLYHTFNVFITHRFMGKDWEKNQLEKLVAKQENRIEKLRTKVEKDAALKADKEVLENDGTSKKKSELTIIAAAAENNALGKDNQLIWSLPDDMQRFKRLTQGHHIIMGRKTFESFPKPLPNRTHIVITNQKNYEVPDGVIVVNSLESALDKIKNDVQPFIIGGGEIYKQAITLADKIELTRVHATFEADAFFPEIDASKWKETGRSFHKKDAKNGYDYSFITYEKA